MASRFGAVVTKTKHYVSTRTVVTTDKTDGPARCRRTRFYRSGDNMDTRLNRLEYVKKKIVIDLCYSPVRTDESKNA